MALPFEPEPLDALRARYPAALRERIDVDSIRLGTQLRPGERRRHVWQYDPRED